MFLIKPVKGININKNCFSPQSEPHIAKLGLSVVLKHFGGNSQRTFLFRHKIDSLRNDDCNSQKVFFLPCFKSGKSWGKFGFV